MFDYYAWDGGDIDGMHGLVTMWLSVSLPKENLTARQIIVGTILMVCMSCGNVWSSDVFARWENI